ncbi:eukaryotic translation initiation factor 3subunit A [Striga asiatica]|uniref:Eukaryotic translation initiation factor 3subunit A n=1 Tax=Striga asiatica TaxID=4170 RepID=A0A5A7R253_STRAF|nr:eukaryotic translation initiation factor 3subunit A [Striga asiatica]
MRFGFPAWRACPLSVHVVLVLANWQRVLLSASPRSLLTQTALCSNRNSASESVSRLPFYRGTERDGLDFLDLEDRHTYSFYSPQGPFNIPEERRRSRLGGGFDGQAELERNSVRRQVVKNKSSSIQRKAYAFGQKEALSAGTRIANRPVQRLTDHRGPYRARAPFLDRTGLLLSQISIRAREHLVPGIRLRAFLIGLTCHLRYWTLLIYDETFYARTYHLFLNLRLEKQKLSNPFGKAAFQPSRKGVDAPPSNFNNYLGLSTPTGSRVAIRTGWTGGNATTGTNAGTRALAKNGCKRTLPRDGVDGLSLACCQLNALTLLWKYIALSFIPSPIGLDGRELPGIRDYLKAGLSSRTRVIQLLRPGPIRGKAESAPAPLADRGHKRLLAARKTIDARFGTTTRKRPFANCPLYSPEIGKYLLTRLPSPALRTRSYFRRRNIERL